MKKLVLIYLSVSAVFFSIGQTVLLPVEEFNSNILVHGTTAPSTVWFAPNYQPPIAWTSSGGCPDGRIGYSSSWNNYWGNFVRLPQINCTGHDTIILSFDVSHSWFSAHTNDWCRFYIWADGGYTHNVVSVLIDSVDVTYDSGINGKGFRFTEVRSCNSVEVKFDISAISNKSNLLLYIEPSCSYNNSNVFYVYFDNISAKSHDGVSVSLEDKKEEFEFLVYPVPASESINLEYKQGFPPNTSIGVFSVDGKVLIKENLLYGETLHWINISQLYAGIYLMNIISEKQGVLFQKSIVVE